VQNIHGGTVYIIAREMGIKTEQLLDFSANINPLGSSPRVKKSLLQNQGAILHYPDRGAYDLLCQLARYHDIPAHSILAGNGSTELIFLLPRVLQLKKVLLVVPTFSEYETSIRNVNGQVFYFKTLEKDQFCINAERLLRELRQGYDALYICNPANPTGVLTPLDMLQDVVKYARVKATRVIIDETFVDFNESQSLKYQINKYENLYILRSMTKFFGLPGLRAGYVISSEKNIVKLRAQQEPWTMNVLAQYASIESLKDRQFIKRTIVYVKEARQKLIAELNKFPCLKIFPSAANYLLLKLEKSAPITVAQLYERLLQKGIIVRKCDSFEGLDDKFFRVAVRKYNENRRLVKELAEALR
jgi:threonine-phosphate decarboxylase